MVRASCLCGAARWELDGPFALLSHCHCSRCRKAHGVGFATYVGVPAERIRLAGGAAVTSFESSPGFWRAFCRHCGTVVPAAPFKGVVFSPVGPFDDEPGPAPRAHIFVGSKAAWVEIADDLPRHEAYPPRVDAPLLDAAAPLPPRGEALRASCLCGGVAFELSAPPLRLWNCHCRRCRKARAAAHASNLFGPAAGARFTRGEDLLTSYKIPQAERFTQAFCRVCGAPMPRIDPARGLVVIPAGSLDDDPGLRPQAHIFVAAKASWWEIRDGAPQYAGYPPA